MKFFILGIISWRFIYATILAVIQYYVWSHNEFSKLFLPPHQSLKYFFQYSWTHFFFNAVLSVGCACLFWLLLRLLKKYQESFFENKETEIGFLCALVVGWPNFLVFAPLVFIFVIWESVLGKIFFRNSYTNLSFAFLLAAIIAFIGGSKLVDILGLGVMRI